MNETRRHIKDPMAKKISSEPVLSFMITLLIVCLVFSIMNIAPFSFGREGVRSLASYDGEIQYIYFFLYLKDVITGNNDISYTFSNLTGSSSFAMLTYYLSSPLNIFLLFCGKKDILVFFDMAIAVKISLCAATFSYFVRSVFRGVSREINITLALCYALMHFTVTQSSNIMWLDGVYMLPLIALGVIRLLEKRSMLYLIIPMALSVIFNWYTAGINVLFISVFFVYLLITMCLEKKIVPKDITGLAVRYVFSMLISLGISSFSFMPTVSQLLQGKGGAFDTGRSSFSGNPLGVFAFSAIGSISTMANVSLFCGSIVLAGVFGFLFSKGRRIAVRITALVTLSFFILSFYFVPLSLVFSLFKGINSYYYRHTYAVIFFMIFLAASFFEKAKSIPVPSFAVPAGLIILSALIIGDLNLMIAFPVILLTAFGLLFRKYYKENKKSYLYMMAAFTLVELTLNAIMIWFTFSKENYSVVTDSIVRQEQLASLLKQKDQNYRVNQITSEENNAYNFPLAFGYRGISTYSSCSPSGQLAFLDSLGYRVYENTLPVISTSQLTADSLLSTKYIISSEDYPFYEKTAEGIYVNPYAFPIAFRCSPDLNLLLDRSNPFEYQNSVISIICGDEHAAPMKPAFIDVADVEGLEKLTVSPADGDPVYFYIKIRKDSVPTTMKVNGSDEIEIDKWLAPSVYYIGADKESDEIEIRSEDLSNIEGLAAYYADTAALSKLSEDLQKNSCEIEELSDGKIRLSTDAVSENEMLFLSVAYDMGWTVSVNGQKTDPVVIDSCFMMIPLQQGKNKISLDYSVPYLKHGCIVSFTCIAAAAVLAIYRKKEEKKALESHSITH